MNSGTSLYRYYDEQFRLLYVGIANNPLLRQSQHKGQPWFRAAGHQVLQHFDTRAEAEAAEAEAIRNEFPLYNKVIPTTHKPLSERQRAAWELWRNRSRWPHRKSIRALRRSRSAEAAEKKRLELQAAVTAKKRHGLAERLWGSRHVWDHRLRIRQERRVAEQRALADERYKAGGRASEAGVVRMDQLTEPQRRIVLTLIEAAKSTPRPSAS